MYLFVVSYNDMKTFGKRKKAGLKEEIRFALGILAIYIVGWHGANGLLALVHLRIWSHTSGTTDHHSNIYALPHSCRWYYTSQTKSRHSGCRPILRWIRYQLWSSLIALSMLSEFLCHGRVSLIYSPLLPWSSLVIKAVLFLILAEIRPSASATIFK